jgi:hypothetical protein
MLPSSITFHLAIKLATNMKLSPFYALLTGYVVLAQCNKTSWSAKILHTDGF